MVRSQHDFNTLRTPGAPFLHTTSYTFGLADRGEIVGSFLAAGRELNRQLVHLTDGVASGSLTVPGFVDSASGAIFKAYYHAYSLGAISMFPFYTMTDRDSMVLQEELSQETGFLRAFGRDLASHQMTLDPRFRARLYLLALRGIFERGRVEAMPPGPYRWRLGNSEHCSECYRAAAEGPYQRTRSDGLGLPTLPGAPGDGSVCLGLTRCGCTVGLDTGVPLPNEELATELRGLLLEAIYGSGTTAEGASA